MEAAIRIEGLVKNYEKFSLDHINLEIPKGQYCRTGWSKRSR